ncbi:MAG: DUF7309 domain-containing protein [Prevotella sp.]|jgi:hypothetical protein
MSNDYQPSPELLKAAFEFRKVELWDQLYDDNIFAVTLPSGEIGYCSVMGNIGQYYGLGLYKGARGFSTFWRLHHDGLSDVDVYNSWLLADVCNCNFSQANNMNFGKKEPIREFAKKYHYSIPRKVGWPEFVKFQPYRTLSPMIEKEDGEDMEMALRAGIEMARLLELYSPEELNLPEEEFMERKDKHVTLLTLAKNGRWTHRSILLPEEEPVVFPQPKLTDESLINQLKNKTKKDSLELVLANSQTPLLGEVDNIAHFMIFGIKDEKTEPKFAICEHAYDEHPEAMMQELIKTLSESTTLPKIIYCSDSLCENLCRDFCQKAGISLVFRKRSQTAEDFLYFFLYGRLSPELLNLDF